MSVVESAHRRCPHERGIKRIWHALVTVSPAAGMELDRQCVPVASNRADGRRIHRNHFGIMVHVGNQTFGLARRTSQVADVHLNPVPPLAPVSCLRLRSAVTTQVYAVSALLKRKKRPGLRRLATCTTQTISPLAS